MDVSGLDQYMTEASQNAFASVETQSNPFALPPLKKARHSENVPHHSPVLALSGPSQTLPGARDGPSAQMILPVANVKPMVRFNDDVQVHGMARHPTRPAAAKVPRPFARMTATARVGYKRPRANLDDHMSDVEEELRVMDTPTWSQHELESTDDSDIEIIDGPSTKFETLSIKRSSPALTEIPAQSSTIQSGDQPSGVSRAFHLTPMPGTTPHLQQPQGSDNRSQDAPVQSAAVPQQPSKSTPSHQDSSTFYDRIGIKNRRRDLHDEMQRLISDTEEARREVSKEVSMDMIQICDT